MRMRILAGAMLALCGSGAAATDVTLSRMAAESMYGAIGGDPARARDWVAAHIYWEDYQGVAKGAPGAWMSRSGNGPDQALLLASLMGGGRPGEQRRFAWCTLTAAQESGFGHPRAVRAEVLAPPVALGWAMRDEALFGAVLEVWQGLGARREAAARYAGDLGPALKFLPAAAPPPAPEGERPHVWVQVEIAGSWKDFDPATADGTPPCTATDFSYALPDAWTQQVRLSMVLETVADGKATEAIVLSRAYDLPRASLTRMSFGFAEGMQPSEKRVLDKTGLATYTPVALFDGVPEAGTPFKMPPPGSAIVAGPRVTAGYLEVAFEGPGAAAGLFRTTLFDALGPAARAYGNPGAMTPTPFSVMEGEYAPLAGLWQVAVLGGEGNAQALAAQDLDPSRADGLSGALDGALRLAPAMLHRLGALPRAPMVLVAGVMPGVSAPQVTVEAMVAQAVVPDAARAAADGAALLETKSWLAGLISGAVVQSDAGAVFDAARGSRALVVLKAGDTPAAEAGSADALAAMKQRLADGMAIVVPATPPAGRTAWWVFDPRTGLLRDEAEHASVGGAAVAGESEPPSWAARYGAIACRLRAAPAFVLPFVLAEPDDVARVRSDGDFARRVWAQRAAASKQRGNPCGA